jgi:CubicO group peptidase (beta-lactamase class C family)
VDASAPLERLRRYVDRHREHLATPGLSLAVTDRDRALGGVVDGLASVEAGVPVAAHHRFQIGSISKGFTALAVMQEVEAGRIDLQAPVTAYLPWFEVRTDFPPITIHHLLSHTSGLIIGMEATGEARSEVWSLRETVTGFAPGERFLYSNVGHKALGLVLEAVTGRPWWEVVRERVAEPIGMGGVDVVITDDVRERLAVGHASPRLDRLWLPRHGWAASPWFESGTADGTICATAEELTAYARLLLRSGAGVVSAASFERMTTPHDPEPEPGEDRFGYGLKWVAAPTGEAFRLLGHTGGMVGFSAILLVDVRAGFGAVALMNSAFGRRLDLARFALACLAAEAAGEPLPEVPDPPDPLRVPDAGRYAGRYADAAGEIVVEAEGERLAVEAGGRRAQLVPDVADVFVVDDPVLERFPIRFLREDGATTGAFWGDRWLVGAAGSPAEPAHPDAWAAYPGRYVSWNPWAPGFRVFLRRGELWLAFTGDASDADGEQPLTDAGDGSFRLGEPWSPDRVRFDTVIDGRTTRAVLDAAPYYRTFVP